MDLMLLQLAAPVALACVALLGYLVGRVRRRGSSARRVDWTNRMERANALIAQAESLSDQLRRVMATHHSTVSRCQQQIQILSQGHDSAPDPAHLTQLQAMLAPTQELSDDIAHAYDQLRRHSHALRNLRSHAQRASPDRTLVHIRSSPGSKPNSTILARSWSACRVIPSAACTCIWW